MGTARTYACRLALWVTWTVAHSGDETAPDVEHLAAFVRWLERTPSRKYRAGTARRRVDDAKFVTLGPPGGGGPGGSRSPKPLSVGSDEGS